LPLRRRVAIRWDMGDFGFWIGDFGLVEWVCRDGKLPH
jgi:hypothetical protein